ncbi:uncharacterized protein N7477_001290 [Penicillium maclennaniae]|uniref:uncharacterized protein n=1 Tax=Penicillium maclennaniae TaxID=1343394 RepID=UPI0025401D45|nr:uncharacterized protein N7477_001290 [Penicillium maclennaniae]KAJ5681350.1 hypothetical protein N7477_001290 [Penicillium maclennaniae]
MLPGLESEDVFQETQQPRVFDFMHDTDFAMSDNDLFGTEFIPDLDRILDTMGPFPELEDQQQSPQDDQDSARRRAAAFQRSLWLWIQEKNQHAFSDEGKIPLRDSDSIPTAHQSRLDALQIPGNLFQNARDDIFKLVLRTAGSRLSVSAFPSAGYLDNLIKIGVEYQQLRPEFLTALVAAGCVCCGLPSINKTGIILQEITRVGLAQLALRRAMAFAKSAYNPISPHCARDDLESLQKTWHYWVRQESLKRLVYHLFGHDVEVAMSMNRSALISYTELTLPLPAARDLWLAQSAQEWKQIWTSRYDMARESEMSLRDLLSDPSLINHVCPQLDLAIARSALLHGLAIQVWEFRQQNLLSQGSQSVSRATARLWLQSRKEDLYTTLRTTQNDSPDQPRTNTLMHEFVMMYLHIDVDAIQRFVGRMGELEARRAYPGLRDWSHTKEARVAIWHAGQVFKAARAVKAYQLRGLDYLAVYHAALVLWVYGLLQCGETRKVEVDTPMSEGDTVSRVALDSSEDQLVKAFLARGNGRPGLTMYHHDGNGVDPKTFCELRIARSIMPFQ